MTKENVNPEGYIKLVDEAFRKNPSSLTAGGDTLLFEYTGNRYIAYPNIKNIRAYVRRCDLSDVVFIKVKARKPDPETGSYSLRQIYPKEK